MRTLSLLLLSFILAVNLQAQNYEITFTGSGESTSVGSVMLVYLSKGDTINLSGSDMLKLSGDPTKVPSSFSVENGLSFYPNPMKEEGKVSFYNSVYGAVDLAVYDVSGKVVTRGNKVLQAGNHTFSLSGLSSGIYTLRVGTPDRHFSTRIISVERNAGIPALRHENSEQVSISQSTKKSTTPVTIPYTDGDEILLKGISGNYQRIVTMVPSESQVVNFEFAACTDADGNHYPVVTIGTQTWMAENLTTSKFEDGTDIMNIEGDAIWGLLEIPAWVWPFNDEDYASIGKLYNWFVAGGDKNPCPTGWHVPSHEEYMVLHHYLIENHNWPGTGANTDNIGWAGKSIAHISTWNPHTRVPAVGNEPLLNNSTGLSIVSSTARRVHGGFRDPGEWSFFWTSTYREDDPDRERAHNYTIRYDFGRHENWTTDIQEGFNIRCIKD